MLQFDAPEESLGTLDAQAAGKLIAAAGDMALVVDEEGVIRDMAFGSEDLSREGHAHWLGKRWIDTVTEESRPKVEALLRGDAPEGAPRWRHINQQSRGGTDIPLMVSAIHFTREGRQPGRSRAVAFGRDLRATHALQQRLVEAQQLMERDYSRFRQAETRYRQLFQISAEAVLIVDAGNQKVVECNPAARALLGDTANRVVGNPLRAVFDTSSASAVQTLLAGVRAAGRDDQVLAQLPERQGEVTVHASLFRLEAGLFVLVRLAPRGGGRDGAARLSATASSMQQLAHHAVDAMVVTDPAGRVVSANQAFVELVQLLREDQVQGQALDRWLGRTGVDLSVLLSNLRQGSAVRLYASTLRGEYGTSTDVEVSAVSLPDAEPAGLGFVIRDVARRLPGEPTADVARELAPSITQLRELVGRTPLKDIVGKTNDLIEQMCIEAALELTRDNRASAAEMLGLSRQSLYVKLRRYGLSERETDPDD